MGIKSKLLRATFLSAAIGIGYVGCQSHAPAGADTPAPPQPHTQQAVNTPGPANSNSINPFSEEDINVITTFMLVRQAAMEMSVNAADADKLLQGALDGMLKTLSPHDAYLSKEAMETMLGLTPPTVGIGIIINARDTEQGMRVTEIIEGGPADRAKLQIGDIITAVNGQSIAGMPAADATNLVKGEEGTDVSISVLRGTDTLHITLTREPFKAPHMTSKMIGDVGYVKLHDFSSQTATQDVETAINQLQHANASALILDLRNNGGGMLSEARGIVDLFVDSNDVITTVRGRGGNITSQLKATPGDILNEKPIVVLINDASASASEIVAGALQDFNRATIIGTQSFGKGSVQRVMDLGRFIRDRDDGFKITIAHYYLPSDTSIQNIGITPDILVEGVENAVEKHERDQTNALQNPTGENAVARRTSRASCAANENATPENVPEDARTRSGEVDQALLCALDHIKNTNRLTNTRPIPAPTPQI